MDPARRAFLAAPLALLTRRRRRLEMGWRVVNIVAPLVIIQSGIPNTGLFVYNGVPAKGNLVAAIVAPGVTSDPFGNTVSAVANFGTWSAAGALLQHFGINISGDIFLANNAGKTILHGRSSDGSLFFYNTSGEGAGNLTASIAAAAGTDPAGNANLSGVDAYLVVTGVGAGTYAVKLGDNVYSGEAAVTFNNQTNPTFGAPAVQASASSVSGGSGLIARSGRTAAGSAEALLSVVDSVSAVGQLGAVSGAGLIIANAPSSFTGQVTHQGIATPSAPAAGNAILFADTSGFLRMLTGLAGDTNSYFIAYSNAGASATPQTISSTTATTITGCTFPVGIGNYAFRARVVFQGASASGTANFSVSAPANTGPEINAAFNMSTGTAGAGVQLAALGPVNSPTQTTGNSIAEIEGELTTTASGTLALQCATSAGGANVLIEKARFWLYPIL